MAFRDAFHSALVYFGLADDAAYEEEIAPYPEPEEEMQDSYRENRTVRRLPRRRRDEFDDIFPDDDDHRTNQLRTVPSRANGRGGGSGDVQLHFVEPKSFNDVQEVADKFKETIPVILNLQAADNDLSKRLIDFASGLNYALDGGMQRIADKVFLLTPKNVEVSAEARARILEKDFFNQS